VAAPKLRIEESTCKVEVKHHIPKHISISITLSYDVSKAHRVLVSEMAFVTLP